MKKKLLALIIALVTLVASFAVISLAADNTDAIADQIVLSFGKNETERNLTWFSEKSTAGEVRLAEASKVVGGVFPTEYKTFSVTSKASNFESGKYSKKATITGLSENTRYAYVFAVGTEVSDIYYFDVGSFGDFDFVFIADPQLIKTSDTDKWRSSLNKIINDLGADLIVSGGDQVNTADSVDLYNAFLVDEMAGVTFAPSVGPGHEESPFYSEHYNVPNPSSKYGSNSTSSNYWYVYNNVLFMHLNSSDRDAFSNGEHEAFIREAMAANPDVDWNIVVTHYSLFSTGLHGSEMIKYRNPFAPKLTELGVDLVLSAHDHVYVRTHMMDGIEVSDDFVVGNTVYAPEGTLYVESNSVSGTKLYNQELVDQSWVAKEDYKHKCAIKFEVTETTLSMKSYYLDDMTVFDTFTIDKNMPESVDVETELEGVDVTIADGVLLNFYIKSSKKLIGIDNAELVKKNGVECYKITVNVAAKEMSDVVTVQLKRGDMPVGRSFSFSVKEYADGLISGNYSSQTKALAQALLAYGAAAQNYFGYKTDSLAGTPVTDISKLAAATVEGAGVTDSANIFVGASLVLEGNIKLRFYFKGNNRLVTVAGKTMSAVNENGYCYAEIGVVASDFDKVYEVKCGSTTVKYSVLNYLKNNVDDAELSEIVSSIYAYGVAAEEYFKSTVVDYPISSIKPLDGCIEIADTESDACKTTVYKNNSSKKGAIIDLSLINCNVVTLKKADGVDGFDYVFLKEAPVNGKAPVYSDGFFGVAERRNDASVTLEIPSDAKYLYLTYEKNGKNYLPGSIEFSLKSISLPSESLSDETLEKYEYPLQYVDKAEGSIYNTDGEFKNKDNSNGYYRVALIDITGCSFDYVRFGGSFTSKDMAYTFLTEMPSKLGDTLKYASGYSNNYSMKWISEDDAHSNMNNESSSVAIPSDATVLAVYYVDFRYANPYDDYWGPSYIVFERTVNQNPDPEPEPEPSDKKVLLVSIDGLRPDILADSKYYSDLIALGSYSLGAQTIYPSLTFPAHLSMFYGVSPNVHGVTSNSATLNYSGNGITEALVAKGKTAAMFYDWKTLDYLSRSSAVIKNYNTGSASSAVEKFKQSALASTNAVISHIKNTPTDFTFLYYGLTDETGEAHNFDSAQYRTSLDYVLENLLKVLAILPDDYVVIITSDHGGGGVVPDDHGSNNVLDMTIPLFVIGEGFEAGKPFTFEVSILDVAPTVADILGVNAERAWEGKSIAEAVENAKENAPATPDTDAALEIFNSRDSWGNYMNHGKIQSFTVNSDSLKIGATNNGSSKFVGFQLNKEAVSDWVALGFKYLSFKIEFSVDSGSVPKFADVYTYPYYDNFFVSTPDKVDPDYRWETYYASGREIVLDLDALLGCLVDGRGLNFIFIADGIWTATGDAYLTFSDITFTADTAEEPDDSEIPEPILYPISSLDPLAGCISVFGNLTTVYDVSDSGKLGALIDLTALQQYNTLTIVKSFDVDGFDYAFLKEELVLGGAPVYCDGFFGVVERRNDDALILQIPADAKYLYLTYEKDGESYLPGMIEFSYEKRASALAGLSDSTLEKFDYPMNEIEMADGSIYNTNGVFTNKDTGNGYFRVAFIDISDCAFDTVRFGTSFTTKNAAYTFLTEMPDQIGETVKYASGYEYNHGMKWVFDTDYQHDSNFESAPVEIPEDATVLVIYYVDYYYNGSYVDYWGPSYIVFE